MKYRAYAVRDINGSRRRHFIGLFDDFGAARYMANCAMCDDVDLAYIEEIGGKTVFFIQSIRRRYNPQPIDPAILGRPNPLLQGLEDHLE